MSYVARVETFDYVTMYRIDDINTTIALASVKELAF